MERLSAQPSASSRWAFMMALAILRPLAVPKRAVQPAAVPGAGLGVAGKKKCSPEAKYIRGGRVVPDRSRSYGAVDEAADQRNASSRERAWGRLMHIATYPTALGLRTMARRAAGFSFPDRAVQLL
jgi:hypothetical protein